MRNSLKRAAAWIFAMLMLLTLLPAGLTAEEETASGAVSDPVIPGQALFASMQRYADIFETLVSEPDPDAFAEMMQRYGTDEGFLAWLANAMESGKVTEEQLLALDEKTAALDAGTSTLDISGETTVQVGETITLSGGGWYASTHNWTSSDKTIATVSGISTTATVRGVVEGKVTITHNYGNTWNQQTETYTVTVVAAGPLENESAQIYYLKTPTSDPDSNKVNQWGDCLGNGTVNMTGATWVDSDTVTETGKNVFSPGAYVVGMASGMEKQSNGSYSLPKDQYASHWNAIFTAYKSSLEEELGVRLSSVDDIEAIYLTPYKISRNNSTTPDKHIDCTISIKVRDGLVFAANFWVILPGTNQQVLAEGKNYQKDSRVLKTTEAPTGTTGDFPDEKTVNGITYRFDGWYDEAGNKIDESSWSGGYLPNKTELADGTVNFYAHYTPVQAEVSVQKVVSSSVEADKTEAFSFTYQINNDEAVTFSLTDGTAETISVPVGATLKVTENLGTDAPFDTTYQIDGGAAQSGTEATFTSIAEGSHYLVFTNTRKTGTLTVKKLVTGNMGDRTKAFAFTYNYTLNDVEQTGTFNLANDGTHELKDLPYGTEVTLTENEYTDYKTTYAIGEEAQTEGRAAKVTIGKPTETVTFTNHKEATPDTGVLLDSLPYVLILACVIAIGAVAFVRKRRRGDDE